MARGLTRTKPPARAGGMPRGGRRRMREAAPGWRRARNRMIVDARRDRAIASVVCPSRPQMGMRRIIVAVPMRRRDGDRNQVQTAMPHAALGGHRIGEHLDVG